MDEDDNFKKFTNVGVQEEYQGGDETKSFTGS